MSTELIRSYLDLINEQQQHLEENPIAGVSPSQAGVTASPKQAARSAAVARSAAPAAAPVQAARSAAPAAAPLSTELNPIVKENLPQGLRQIADGIEEGNYKSVQDVMKDFKFLVDQLVKQSTR